jgi:polysaccharide biosynthesis/export protein
VAPTLRLFLGHQTPIGAMQHRNTYHLGWRLLAVIVAVGSISSGCAPLTGWWSGRTYHASRLPPALMAPSVMDLETLNLSGLTDQSVSAEVIQPGDVLEVSMINDFSKLTTTTTPVRVADDGTIVIPLIGRINVGGMEVVQAEQSVNAESVSRGVFRNPSVTLTMKQCRTQSVTVTGAVNRPGAHSLPRGSTSLMAAILAADGLSKEAGTEVEIRRTDSRRALAQQPHGPDGTASPVAYEQPMPIEVIRVDLKEATKGAIKTPELHDGDVVHVSKRTLPPVYVIGLVVKPGSVPYPPNQEIRVLDALAMAGGCSNPVAEEILVIRRVPGAKEPVRIAVSLQAAKNGEDNMALAPGDTVSVERTAATSVVDVIQTFFRFSLGSSVSWF